MHEGYKGIDKGSMHVVKHHYDLFSWKNIYLSYGSMQEAHTLHELMGGGGMFTLSGTIVDSTVLM